MNALIIKDVIKDTVVEHIAHVIFMDTKSKLEFVARLDLGELWFIDPVRFEQEKDVNKKIATMAH